jgi:hypothetical protein
MVCTPAELLAEPNGPYPVPGEALTAEEVRDVTRLPFAKEDESDFRASFLKGMHGDYLEEAKELCKELNVPDGPFARVALTLARMVKGEPASHLYIINDA